MPIAGAKCTAILFLGVVTENIGQEGVITYEQVGKSGNGRTHSR